ncbi:hypothetical protein Axi01nite_97280 [Actinoplanes xinjiangensis]|nr:hypothetical protein Axi01nite_97280 [Actinoplanes xinjiangensis]
MDNGSGDAWSIVFSPAGAFVRGFDHESSMTPAGNDEELWPGLVATVPEMFSAAVNEPAFSYEGTLQATGCLWRQTDDDRWHAGNIGFPNRPDPDGADRLSSVLLDTTGLAYHRFAEDYLRQGRRSWRRPRGLRAVPADNELVVLEQCTDPSDDHADGAAATMSPIRRGLTVACRSVSSGRSGSRNRVRRAA